ncbi:MAG: T9SS type A sorting domain-containing protein, partial [Gemmatimonadota bacterium]
RNIVIDYPVIRRHCPDPDFESWWTAEDSTTEYLRDCERWLWPKHRWVGAEHPWASVVFPIPVYNGEPYPDNIDLWIDEGAFPPHIPPGWGYSFDVDAFNLLPGEEAVANLTIVPKGSGPPLDLPAHVVVQAAKGFCKRDTDYVDIKFMPYTGMCIRDTSGIKVMYKYSESCGGRDPSLVPGDRVNVGLMLDNEYPVSAVQIDLGYDAEYLRVVDVQTTARTTGFELVHRELAPGTHEIALYSTPSHPDIDISPQRVHCELPPGYEHVGLLSIVSVTFEVLPGAPAGTCADIWYGTVILDGLPDWGGHPKEPLCLKYEDKGQICFGGYLVPVKCDVTGRGGLPDTMVTLTDLYAILNHMLGNEPQLSGSVTQPGTQRWAADASGDQLINIIDLMKCINRAVGVCDPKVIVADVEVEEVVGLTGRTVALPVRVSSEVDVAGMLLRLSYDRGALLAGEPMLMDRASGMDLVYGHVGGELVLLISDLTGEVIEAGGGPILRIPFEVSERVAQETLIEMAEPIVFTTDERIVFGASSIFAVRVEALVPAEYSLAQNYPNPFNPTTDIQFQIADNGSPVQTTLKIYNILGQEVRTLVNEEKEPGYYTLTWDGRNEEGNEVPSGVYFYSMEAGDFQATKRMVLMK